MSDIKNMDTTVENVDIDIDEVFGVGVDNITLPEEETKKPNILDRGTPEADFSFTESENKTVNEEDVLEETPTSEETVVKDKTVIKEEGSNILDEFSLEDDNIDETVEEEKPETRGRKAINGFADIITKMVKSDTLFAFDDDKPLEEYSAKDIQELLEANLEEKANQVRRETPKQFFDALPNELKVAAQYVADGGTDLKSLKDSKAI